MVLLDGKGREERPCLSVLLHLAEVATQGGCSPRWRGAGHQDLFRAEP